MIDIQRLRVLSEVARHGSFSKAAAALLFTPSAVSQQIAALERTLGTAVVDRSTRGVVLTEPGRLLVEAADAITAELRNAQEQIGRLAQGYAQRLTVATFTSGGHHLLPPALSRFTAAHPDVEVTVVEHEPEDSVQLVRRGEADLALAYHYVGATLDRAGVDWTALMDDPMWIVLPPRHPLSRRKRLRLTDLAGERWVLGCQKDAELLHRYAALAGFELKVACATTDYLFAQSLVDAGVGVSPVPTIALQKSANAVALEQPRPDRRIGMVTQRRRHPQPHVEALREVLLGLN